LASLIAAKIKQLIVWCFALIKSASYKFISIVVHWCHAFLQLVFITTDSLLAVIRAVAMGRTCPPHFCQCIPEFD